MMASCDLQAAILAVIWYDGKIQLESK